MKNVIKYLCAVLMVIGTSESAWGADIPSGYTAVTAISSLATGDYVVLFNTSSGKAITGWDGTKDATVSSTKDDWMQFKVTKGTDYIYLQDESTGGYIGHDGTQQNKFLYVVSGYQLTIEESSGKGKLKLKDQIDSKTYYLGNSSSNHRFYGSSPGTYYMVYKVNSPTPPLATYASCNDISIDAGTYSSDPLTGTVGPYTISYTFNSCGRTWYGTTYSTDAGLTLTYKKSNGSNYTPTGQYYFYHDPDDGATTDVFKLYYSVSGAGTYNGSIYIYSWNEDTYDYDYVYINVTVTAAASCTSPTITMSNFSKDFGDADFVPTHTVSAGSGTKTWTSGTASVATIVDGKVHIVGAGTSLITLNVAASGDYCAVSKSCTMTVNAVAPTVTDFTASCTNNKITVTNANASTVSNKGGKAITRYGYLYSTSVSTPTFGASGVSDAYVGTTDVTKDAKWAAKDITGLSAGTTYYVRAYAYNGSEYGYSSVVTVTTKCAVTYAGNGGTGTVTDASSPYAKGSNVTVLANGFTAPDGKKFVDWLGSNSTHYAPGATISSISTDITLTAQWTDVTYSDYKFSCAELTLTAKLKTAGTPIFITSTANKTVRSQDTIHISGSGLTPSTTLTFPGLSSKFEIKKANGDPLATNSSGAIEEDAFIFYTPGEGDTSDGLDKLLGITISVSGAKPKQVSLSQTIIGRHLPADFVIAAKKDGKWWALPSDMASTTNPKPSEIAVNDINNPSVAYTNASNKYGLAAPTASNISGGNGQYIRLTMSIEDGNDPAGPAPLFGSATGTRTLGKSSNAKATSDLSAGWWWQLKQTNTSITNPQDAKYTIYCANNTSSLSLRDNAGNPDWGLFASGVEELRLIPASTVVPTEAYFVEWAQHGGVIEVDAGGVGATKVQAVLNGTESAFKTLSQTCTSVKNRASIYNYTLNFNDVGHVIDFAASTSNGAMLTLRWLDGGENLVAVSNITVPKIVATNTSMSSIESGDTPWSKWEVHVLPGVTLTANAGSFSSGDVTIKNLEIYQGATVKVTTGTLDVTNLVLRNGWSRAGSKRYDVARVHIATTANLTHTNAYADWYIDYDQYYPMAVPWDVTVSGISYRYTSLAATVGHDKNIRLRYYDGALRVNGGNGTGTNWRLYGDAGAESVPTTLKPSQGYAITAKRPAGKAFAILRMPLTFADTWTALGEQGEVSGTHKDQVTVTAHGVGDASKSWYAVGWNFIGNPYMSCFDSNEDDFMNKLIDENGKGVKYATIPDTEFEGFDQVNIASVGNKLKPSSGFFVQVGSTGSLRFKQGQIITPSAPARYTNEQEAIPEQEALILLNGEQGHDQMGLVIGSDYTADYEMNADLSKMLGNANIVKTWMRYTDMDMAYVAINEQLAREWIPVTVHIPAEGEYTYSLMNSSTVDELEGLYLIDYETGAITNLIYDEYIFTAEAGTQSGRFAINAIVGERKVPTGADITGVDKNGNEPVKFIWHDKVYILHNSVIYDATGKRVNVINK